MAILTTDADIRRVLETHPTVAVLGASDQQGRAGFYVAAYLADQGFRVLPVNPRLAGTTLHGQTVRASLAELDEPVDLVDVFRRPDQLPGHVDELMALGPRTVWFQLGIRHDLAARRLADAGIDVVQDRCTLADHRAWGLGAPTRPTDAGP